MEQLRNILGRIDGKGYKAYKDIQGRFEDKGVILHIDYVQPDPFANPSRVRLEIQREKIGYKDSWLEENWRRVALEDVYARRVAQALAKQRFGGKSGISIDAPGQEVLERTAVRVTEGSVEVRLSVGLPAQGRRILGRQAGEMLYPLPNLLTRALAELKEEEILHYLQLADRQQAIRDALEAKGLVSFVANGSILPRASGISNLPLKDAVVFMSPPDLEVEIEVPHSKSIRGMGIPQGVTLIVGGGYHGKSTLLKAVERGVYNHTLGDGREYVLTNASASKIRAEDGRPIENVDISPFISQLPYGRDTKSFSTLDASGSTSQAANIMEALEVGAKVLLMDEDTSATNFMIRDARMQALVVKDKEPITPFVDQVRKLYRDLGLSTVVVIGGSGDYLDVADTVIMMDEYRPFEVTAKAKAVAREVISNRTPEGGGSFNPTSRVIKTGNLNPSRGNREKVDAKGLNTILFGRESIDLSGVEQLVDVSQTRAIAAVLGFLARNNWQEISLVQLLERVNNIMETQGLEGLSPFPGHPGDMARPRPLELAAAINRLRSMRVR